MPLPGGAGARHEGDPYPLRPGDVGYDALADLWSRLSRPFGVLSTVSVITGLSRPAVGELVGAVVATSPEAEHLLHEFPHTIRALATSMGTQAERCIGALRGPVLWSETLAARASSFGDPDLFVCATPSRAYDIDENRVLVAALLGVRDAARDAVEHVGGQQRYQDPRVREAIRNGNDAGRYAEHPSLSQVSRAKPTPRAIKRARSGKKAASYAPALRMLERLADPLTLDHLHQVCDRRTRAQHEVLMGLVHGLEDLGGRLPSFRAEGGALWAGPIQYRHAGRVTERGGPAGIVVGQLLVDVPERWSERDRERATTALAARAGGMAHHVVLPGDDLGQVVALAVDLAQAG